MDPMVTINDAMGDLYRIAVTEERTQSTSRLNKLAEFCIQELGRRGLKNAESEVTLPGGARDKKWDIAWKHDEKYRLSISLKSILRNIAGTVPNRIDDLIGEVANAQMYSPEIVIGYIMVFDTSQDRLRQTDGKLWCAFLEETLDSLTGRSAPAWSTGTLEAIVLIQVDFSRSANLLTKQTRLNRFFNKLVKEVKKRNPSV